MHTYIHTHAWKCMPNRILRNICKPGRNRSSHDAPLLHVTFASTSSSPSTWMNPDVELFVGTRFGPSESGLPNNLMCIVLKYDAPPSFENAKEPAHPSLLGFRTSILSKEAKHLSTTTSPGLYNCILSPEETVWPLTMTSKVPSLSSDEAVSTRRQTVENNTRYSSTWNERRRQGH